MDLIDDEFVEAFLEAAANFAGVKSLAVMEMVDTSREHWALRRAERQQRDLVALDGDAGRA
jgi:hypothetical protein